MGNRGILEDSEEDQTEVEFMADDKNNNKEDDNVIPVIDQSTDNGDANLTLDNSKNHDDEVASKNMDTGNVITPRTFKNFSFWYQAFFLCVHFFIHYSYYRSNY